MLKRIASLFLLFTMLVSCSQGIPQETSSSTDVTSDSETTFTPTTEEDGDDKEVFTEYFEGNALYTEKWRPYYHFTTKMGWINDPNGLVYHNGTYHIYYQHNPNSNLNGNIHWGHATSNDLVHFEEHKPALYPDSTGTMFSGTAYSDKENRSGLFDGVEGGGIIAAYSTSTQKIGIAYSVDGQNYKKLGIVINNTTIKHFRDPKLFWDDISGKWTMVIAGGTVRFYQSDDLKNWKCVSVNNDINTECPDFFPAKVEGTDTVKWVLTCAGRHFYVGRWDGTRFTPETGKITLNYGPDAYAGIIISNEPSGKILMISWMNNWSYSYPPDGQWCGANTLVSEMKLTKSGSSYLMIQKPIDGYSALEGDVLVAKKDVSLMGDNVIEGVGSAAYKAHFAVDVNASDDFVIEFCKGDGESVRLSFDVKGSEFTFDRSASLTAIDAFKNSYGKYSIPINKKHLSDGVLEFDVYIDTANFELYACGGAYLFAARIQPLTSSVGMAVNSAGTVKLNELTVTELDNIHDLGEDKVYAVHANSSEIVTALDDADGEFVYACAFDGTDNYSVELSDTSIAEIKKKENGFFVYPKAAGETEIKVTSGNRYIVIPLKVYEKSVFSSDVGEFSLTKAELEYRPDGLLLSPAGGDGFALGDVYQKDVDFSADITFEKNSVAGALVFRAKDVNNFYCFTADYSAKTAKIWMKTGGTSSTLTTSRYDFAAGKTYELRVKTEGHRIYAFINGERVISIINTTHSDGLIGLNAYKAPVLFNNVKVAENLQINVASDIPAYKPISGMVGKSDQGFFISLANGDGFAVADLVADDFEYSADVKITKGTAAAALVFRYSQNNFYCATVDASAQVVKLWKRVNGQTTVLRTVHAAIELDRFYDLSVKAEGRTIEIYLDGKLMIKTSDTSHSKGALGINVFKGGAFFNNIEYSEKN
ncbi:MAG: glycoside hydrolase family 32 protein [Clostridia bacterium]|nr:glycoside hydrolase family 32 protein [Clostridia bacterium]